MGEWIKSSEARNSGEILESINKINRLKQRHYIIHKVVRVRRNYFHKIDNFNDDSFKCKTVFKLLIKYAFTISFFSFVYNSHKLLYLSNSLSEKPKCSIKCQSKCKIDIDLASDITILLLSYAFIPPVGPLFSVDMRNKS